jgi:hypothetical protein
VAVLGGVVAFAALAALASAWEPLALLAAVALLLGGSSALVCVAMVLWRSRTARRRLRRGAPATGWYLHSFASTQRGAGRVLLERVCDEAEAARRVVYLDTCEGLVDYYRRCGFEPAVRTVMRRQGRPTTVVRMVRALQGPQGDAS